MSEAPEQHEKLARVRVPLIALAHAGDDLIIEPATRLTFNDPVRERESINRIVVYFRKKLPFVHRKEPGRVVIRYEAAAAELDVLELALCDWLAAIAAKPLTPRMVCAALEISSAERIRWSREGASDVLLRT